MRFIPAREDVEHPRPVPQRQHPAVGGHRGASRRGTSIVVDSRGDASAASGGDMLMTRAWKRGAAGFVTDGGLRDGHVLSQLPFPTYASAVTITTRAAWHHVADLQVPIGCAGVAVYPGDVLVADRDGIIVVPRALAAEIAEPSLEQEKLEAYVSHEDPRRANRCAGNYPPGEETIAEYKASLSQPTARQVSGGSRVNGHRVVVVGGGFGGLNVTRGAGRRGRRRDDRRPDQPPPVPAAALPGGGRDPVARADRAGAAQRHQEAAQRRGAAGRRPGPRPGRTGRARASGPDGRPVDLPYDTLVVAAGATHSYFGKDQFAEFAPGMKTVEDARYLRDGILSKFEMAEIATDPQERAEWLTFVVIGAGPDRCRAGRADRRAGAHGAAAGLPLGRHQARRGSSCSRARARCCRRSRRSCRSTPRSGWRRWASRSG